MTFDIKIWQDEKQIWHAESKEEEWAAWAVTPALLLHELADLLERVPDDPAEWLVSLLGAD